MHCSQTACTAASPPGIGAAGPGFSRADLALAERLRTVALADGTTWQLLQSLCNDVGARPAGSAADAKAAAWAQAAMRSLQLQQVRAEAFPMRAWVRSPDRMARGAGAVGVWADQPVAWCCGRWQVYAGAPSRPEP